MEITIRKADAADLDAVVRVYEHVHDCLLYTSDAADEL